MPHRLVHKRMLLFPKQCDEFHDGNDNNPDCCYEWLVKWTGLGYEHATWELDNASFFTSPEAMKLMSDYESRHEKAEILLGPHKADEVLPIMFDPFYFYLAIYSCFPNITVQVFLFILSK